MERDVYYRYRDVEDGLIDLFKGRLVKENVRRQLLHNFANLLFSRYPGYWNPNDLADYFEMEDGGRRALIWIHGMELDNDKAASLLSNKKVQARLRLWRIERDRMDDVKRDFMLERGERRHAVKVVMPAERRSLIEDKGPGYAYWRDFENQVTNVIMPRLGIDYSDTLRKGFDRNIIKRILARNAYMRDEVINRPMLVDLEQLKRDYHAEKKLLQSTKLEEERVRRINSTYGNAAQIVDSDEEDDLMPMTRRRL